MSAENDQSTKEFEPSSRRLEQAREKGDGIRSEEVQSAVVFAAFALGFATFGGFFLQEAARAGMILLQRPQELALSRPVLLRPVTELVQPMVLLLTPAVAAMVWLIASRGITFAPSKLRLKWSRISPVSNAAQKYGPAGLVDFLRRALKLLVVGFVLVQFLRDMAEDLIVSLRLAPGQIMLMILQRLTAFLWLAAAIGAAFGLVDFLWQRHQFLKRNRMTRKEMTDEMRESEGDPHLKADRKRRALEIASRKMLVSVPTADVVIVNPTHFAVALKWDRSARAAPVCVAKGIDEIAAKIRELAMTAGVPIHSDPSTARLLYATLELGQEISPKNYAAVAASIRFADSMRLKSKQRWQ